MKHNVSIPHIAASLEAKRAQVKELRDQYKAAEAELIADEQHARSVCDLVARAEGSDISHVLYRAGLRVESEPESEQDHAE